MPIVISSDGFYLVIYTGHEHLPPHVHVLKAGFHLRVALGDEERFPYVFGKGNTLEGKDLVKAVRLVAEHQAKLLAKWGEIHG